MKIHISGQTPGTYGGRLNGSLRYFDRVITEYLDNSLFQSSFKELWLTLGYPPMYVFPGLVGTVDYKKYYDGLPYSRLDRRYKKIDITLKAPEFSEHFDKAEQNNYEHKFEIENQYKNVSEIDLAINLIDKCITAGAIINEKLTREDIFDFELYKNTLESLQGRISVEYLEAASKRQAAKIKTDTIKLAINLREQRKQNQKPKDKIIRDLRVYYNGLPKKALYPFDYQYSEIFLNILRKKELMCPNYHHLYIQVAKSIDDYLKDSIPHDNWYVCGLSVIDYNKYLQQNESQKDQTVFTIILNGLRDIAEVDALDASIIESAAEEIKLKGLDTELEHLKIDGAKYMATITYFSKSYDEGNPVYLNLLEKSTGKWSKKQIGKTTQDQLHYWISKLSINNSHIKIKARNSSFKADAYLEDKPRNMEFSIKDLINE